MDINERVARALDPLAFEPNKFPPRGMESHSEKQIRILNENRKISVLKKADKAKAEVIQWMIEEAEEEKAIIWEEDGDYDSIEENENNLDFFIDRLKRIEG